MFISHQNSLLKNMSSSWLYLKLNHRSLINRRILFLCKKPFSCYRYGKHRGPEGSTKLAYSRGFFCFVHPIFSSFGFWYFGHFSCVIFFPVFFRLAHLALQNVNKDYIIFLYFRNFITKSDQKPEILHEMVV